MSFGKTISVFIVCFIVLWFGGNSRPGESFEILRGKHDIFSNSECLKDSDDYESDCSNFCDDFDAVCNGTSDCKYCVCKKDGRNTFLGTSSSEEKCVTDEEIVPESVPEDSFQISNNNHGLCVTVQKNGYVVATECTSSSSRMLWIWTTTKNFMNIQTMECITSPAANVGNVTMKSCNHSSKKQQWVCRDKFFPYQKLFQGQERYLRFEKEGTERYMTVDPSKHSWSQLDKRRKSICSSTSYQGCYRFSDGSLLQFLSLQKCQDCLSVGILAPIFVENVHCSVDWEKSKYLQRHGPWNSVNGKNTFFSVEKTEGTKRGIKLQMNRNAFKVWNGSLLKLAITCKAKPDRTDSSEDHCVLLKFETLPPNPQVKSTLPSVNINSPGPTTRPFSTTTLSSELEQNSDASWTKAIAITVPIVLLVLFVILASGFLVLNIRRKRLQEQPNSEDMHSRNEQNNPKAIYEHPSQLYETLEDYQQETGADQAYQGLVYSTKEGNNNQLSHDSSAKTPIVYDYANRDEIGSTNPTVNPEYEYSYPSMPDQAKLVNTQLPTTTPSNAVYQTLEGPKAVENPVAEYNELADESPNSINKPLENESSNPLYETSEDPCTAQNTEQQVEYVSIIERRTGKNYSDALAKSSADVSAADPLYHELDSL